MEIIRTPQQMQNWAARQRCDSRTSGQTVGFVPTMGALHEGHLTLARRARQECDVFVASIFVNPMQFGAGEDFGAYARPFERDCELLRLCGCDVLFAPDADAMYPAQTNTQSSSTRSEDLRAMPAPQTWIEVSSLGEIWEGAVRPGHLRGVATIVTKLFNLVRPTHAYFGEKDYQQLKVVQHLVRDLCFDIEIVPCETIREADGLAMSSRNAYLSAEERASATVIYRALRAGVEQAQAGEHDVAQLGRVMQNVCAQEQGLHVQYIAIVESETLAPLQTLEDIPARILIAARIGSTRLIDNMAIS
jgi:pantoate--beta-alanine ligase